MVGAFGEVQVMDWGRAKVLADTSVADRPESDKHHEQRQYSDVVQTQRSGDSDAPYGDASQARMGSVMGTPAYMPPDPGNSDMRANLFDSPFPALYTWWCLYLVVFPLPPFSPVISTLFDIARSAFGQTRSSVRPIP